MRNIADTVPPELRDFFKSCGGVALAFSGGADSSYLFYAGTACGADMRAYFVKSQFIPRAEMEGAVRTARELGGDLLVMERDVLSDPRVTANAEDRCYWCKKLVFGEIAKEAEKDGRTLLIDGTNASDDPADRPGTRALREMGVRSPLRECGISKTDVRKYSREAGLRTWDLPSAACLATRTPTGTPITASDLLRSERAEEEARKLGLRDFRVRTRGDSAHVETVDAEKDVLEKIRPQLDRLLSEMYPGGVTYGRRVPGL